MYPSPPPCPPSEGHKWFLSSPVLCVGTSLPACRVATDVDMSDEPRGGEWMHLWALIGESIFLPGSLFQGEGGAPGHALWALGVSCHQWTSLCSNTIYIPSVYFELCWRFLLHCGPSGKVWVHWPSEPFGTIYYFWVWQALSYRLIVAQPV